MSSELTEIPAKKFFGDLAQPSTVDDWIRFIYAIRLEEQQLTDKLEALKSARKQAEIQAALFYGEQGVTSARTEDGTQGYIRQYFYVTKKREVPDNVLVDWAKRCGWGDLVKTTETIHHSTLKAAVVEAVETEREKRPGLDPSDCVPAEIRHLLNIHEEIRVTVRGSGLRDKEQESGRERNVA